MKTYGFSLKRLLGVTSAKRKLSRAIGIPLTKSGREQMVGRALLKMIRFGGK